MIILDVQGGLGNQLFIYALGRKLSLTYNLEFKLDISRYKNYFRAYQLDKFNISANLADSIEISKIRDGYGLKSLDKLLFKLRRKILPYNLKPYVMERTYSFDHKILKCLNSTYLSGVWQSEKYFIDIRNLLIKEITIKEELDDYNLDIIKKMHDLNSVSIHVRRGDYITSEKDAANIGSVNMDYYYNAISYFTNKYDNTVFFVFSDEIDWVQDNFDLPNNTIFLNHNKKNNKDYLDMILISHCKFHIIANSSFSWWGAWLCDNPSKEVIAPKIWWKSELLNDKDVVSADWIKM